MASAVFSENKASPFPSPSSSFIPPPPPPTISHEAKRRSVMSAMPAVAVGEMTNGHYYNSQRNSVGPGHPQSMPQPLATGCPSQVSFAPPPPTSKRQSAPPQTQTQTQTQIQIQIQTQTQTQSQTQTQPQTMTAAAAGATLTTPPASAFRSPAYATPHKPLNTCADLVVSTPPSPTLTSTRAAPPSPSISRCPSGWSLKRQSHQPPSPARPVLDAQGGGGSSGDSGAGSLPTPTSAPLSGPLAPVPPHASTPAPDEMGSCHPNPLAQPLLLPLLPEFETERSLIVIRDYGFPSADDRFCGRGPLVPKWNRLSRLNRQLGAWGVEDGASGRLKAKKKKKQKKKTVNGWSDSDDTEGDSDMDSERSSGSDDEDEDGNEESEERDGMVAEEDALEDEEEEEDELRRAAAYGGGSGGFGWFGRLSWRAAAGSSGLVKDTDGGEDRETMSEFPSQNDLERNFGFGQEAGYNYGAEPQEEEGEWGPLSPGLYRALYAFEPEGTAEMGLDEDQIVKVVGRGGGEGWAVVIDTREGRSGGHALVPESYLEVVQLDEDGGDGDD